MWEGYEVLKRAFVVVVHFRVGNRWDLRLGGALAGGVGRFT